jgi:hypothetical protein
MGLNYEQRLQVAQMAKELTKEFGSKLKYTNTSSNQAMNDDLTNLVTAFYSTVYDSIVNKIEEEK